MYSAYDKWDRDPPLRSGLPGGPEEKDRQGFKEKW